MAGAVTASQLNTSIRPLIQTSLLQSTDSKFLAAATQLQCPLHSLPPGGCDVHLLLHKQVNATPL